MEKENTRLKLELENDKKNKEELIGLREFIFSLDKQEEFVSKEIDFNRLKNCRAMWLMVMKSGIKVLKSQ